MNKNELVELLEEMAINDLADGAELHTHPCSVAVKAIDQCYNDINFLKAIIGGSANKKSKRGQMILGLSYGPDY